MIDYRIFPVILLFTNSLPTYLPHGPTLGTTRLVEIAKPKVSGHFDDVTTTTATNIDAQQIINQDKCEYTSTQWQCQY